MVATSDNISSVLDEATARMNQLLAESRESGVIADWRKEFYEDTARNILQEFSRTSLSPERKKEITERAQRATETALTAGPIAQRGLSDPEARGVMERVGGERLTQRLGAMQQYARSQHAGVALEAASLLFKGERLDKQVALKERELMLDTLTKWDQLKLDERLGLSALEIEGAYRQGKLDNAKMALALERVAAMFGFQVEREEIQAELQALEYENEARRNQLIQSGATLIIRALGLGLTGLI